jgi:pimeloyl-ACP methyl ester carboxylesterase
VRVKKVKKALQWIGVVILGIVAVGALGIRCDLPRAEVEARWGVPPSKFRVVDGVRVHYRDRGQGKVIVLLHGANSSLFTWEGWTEALVKDYRVIALDLPGHGLTGPDPRERYTASEMAEVVDKFVADVGVERFTLAGNSMGGSVAWHYAVAHPEKLEALVLVDAGGLTVPDALPLRLQRTPVLGRIARWVTPRFMIARSVREVYGDPDRVDDALIDRYYELIRREGNREATRLRAIANKQDVDRSHERLGELRVPTLILWGRKDRWIPPSDAERFHGMIPGSQVVMFDALGHVPMEEDPVATVAVVQTFLGALAR